MDLLLRMALGIAVGTMGTLVGTGGGWALVPVFLLGFHFSPQEAAATSLSVVFLNALSGTAAYMVQQRVRYKVAILFAAATIPGAILGSFLTQFLDGPAFTRAFSIFLLLVAATLMTRRDSAAPEADLHAELPTSRLVLGVLISALVGVVSSLLGVGGGIIHVPFLVLVLGMGAHAATATSHFVLAVTSGAGVVGHALHGNVRWLETLTVGGGAVVGAQLGARLSKVLPARAIQRVLAILLAAFAVTLLWRSV